MLAGVARLHQWANGAMEFNYWTSWTSLQSQWGKKHVKIILWYIYWCYIIYLSHHPPSHATHHTQTHMCMHMYIHTRTHTWTHRHWNHCVGGRQERSLPHHFLMEWLESGVWILITGQINCFFLMVRNANNTNILLPTFT